MDRLLRCRFWKSNPSRAKSSSFLFSTLMTLAPISASCRTAVGPERARVRSMTVYGSSGRLISASVSVVRPMLPPRTAISQRLTPAATGSSVHPTPPPPEAVMTATALNVPSLKGKGSNEEWAARIDLAAAYRLVSLYKWEDLVFTHISLRVPGAEDEFLINPYGVFFDEITASSLVKIDLKGQKVDDSPFEVNPAGFVIHSAIHAARHDAKCVLH